MDHVEPSGGCGTYVHRHADAGAAVAFDAWDDDRKVSRVLAGMLHKHLRVPLEPTTGQDYRTGGDGALLTVGLTRDYAAHPPLVVLGQLGRLVVVEDVGGLVFRYADQVFIDVFLAAAYRGGEVLILELHGGVLLVVVDQLDAVVLHKLDGVGHLVGELAPVVEVRQALLHSFDPIA